MIDLKQRTLAEWQRKNFGSSTSEDMALGMAEEVGELAHLILKRKQGIRDSDIVCFDNKIADAFADVVIFGIQLMTTLGLSAEDAIRDTLMNVLARDWKNNPKGTGYSKHKE